MLVVRLLSVGNVRAGGAVLERVQGTLPECCVCNPVIMLKFVHIWELHVLPTVLKQNEEDGVMGQSTTHVCGRLLCGAGSQQVAPLSLSRSVTGRLELA